DDVHWGAQCDQRDGYTVRDGRRAMGARQLYVGPADLHGASRAAVQALAIPDGLPDDPRRLYPADPAQSASLSKRLCSAARLRRRQRHHPRRHAAQRIGQLLLGSAGGRRRRLHAAVLEQHGIPPAGISGSPFERSAPSVRATYGVARRISVTLLCNAFIAPTLAAQTGSALAVVPGSARLAGMGGAGAAIVGDAGAIFTNPAGLATIHRLALEGSYEAYPSGATLSTGAMALRAGRFTWGAGAAALGQTYTSADLLGVTSLVFRTGLAAIGTSVKYARETVAGTRADAWAGDVGIAIAVFDIMALGATVQNIGGDLGGGSHLPRRTR